MRTHFAELGPRLRQVPHTLSEVDRPQDIITSSIPTSVSLRDGKDLGITREPTDRVGTHLRHGPSLSLLTGRRSNSSELTMVESPACCPALPPTRRRQDVFEWTKLLFDSFKLARFGGKCA